MMMQLTNWGFWFVESLLYTLISQLFMYENYFQVELEKLVPSKSDGHIHSTTCTIVISLTMPYPRDLPSAPWILFFLEIINSKVSIIKLVGQTFSYLI